MARTAHGKKSIVLVVFNRNSVCSFGRGETLEEAVKNATKAHRDLAGSMRGFGSLLPDSVSLFEGRTAATTLEQIHDDLDCNNLRHCRQIVL